MNNIEINQHLLNGQTETIGVLPHLDDLHSLPFIFTQDFGLKNLPKTPGMIMIRGPRQYGKSTWLEQQIKQTILEFGPGSALYLNGDEIANNTTLLSNLRELISLFPTKIKIKRIFIDEITAIVDWQKAMKRLADAGELKDILIITTGSKATDLRRGFEMLPGRKGELNRTNYIFTPISYKEFSKQCSNVFGENTLYAYILSGGSAIGANSLAKNHALAEYVVNTVTDWVYGEFAQTGRSRAHLLAVLASLFKFGGSNVGQAKLARESDLANNTVANGYIDLLADLMIVTRCYPFDFDRNLTLFRKECKFHFTNLLFAMCMHPKRPRTIQELKNFDAELFAPILEWLVAQELWRRSCIANKEVEFLNFWQTKDHEIDFVTPTENTWLEVKSGAYQVTNFLWFTKYFHNNKLCVINKNRFDSQAVQGITLEDFLLNDNFYII